jgi:hypothetical protein
MDEKSSTEHEQTSVTPASLPYLVHRPLSVIKRYELVSARIVGGGTSSVVPKSAHGVSVPQGAVLVSSSDSGFGTSV